MRAPRRAGTTAASTPTTIASTRKPPSCASGTLKLEAEVGERRGHEQAEQQPDRDAEQAADEQRLITLS